MGAVGGKTRAARIRELHELHSKLAEDSTDIDFAWIMHRLADEGIYKAPSRSAIYRAISYEPTGKRTGRPRKNATYEQAVGEIVAAWHDAVRKSIPMTVTKRIRKAIALGEAMLERDNLLTEET